jgi:hypothetical protein
MSIIGDQVELSLTNERTATDTEPAAPVVRLNQ